MSVNVTGCLTVTLDVIECQKGQCLVSVDVSECSHQAPQSVGHMQLFCMVWYYLCGIICTVCGIAQLYSVVPAE